MNIFSYILLSLLVTGWSINPFLIKQSIGKLSQLQYLCLKLFSILFIILLVYLILILFKKEKIINFFNIFTKNQFYWFISSVLISVFTSILYVTMLKYYDIIYIIPHIQPIIILLTILFGYLFFNETLKLQQLFGIFLIIIGLIFINLYK